MKRGRKVSFTTIGVYYSSLNCVVLHAKCSKLAILKCNRSKSEKKGKHRVNILAR